MRHIEMSGHHEQYYKTASVNDDVVESAAFVHTVNV